MRNKQTTVDWLMGNIDIDFNSITNTTSMRKDIWEKAKQIEKEQIKDAWKDASTYRYSEEILDYMAEQYYNETYGK